MDLAAIILGPVVTEKAERLKAQNTYVMRVAKHATKIDVKNALRKYYDVDIASIRMLRTVPKSRQLQYHTMVKRGAMKHAIVRLGKKSKSLDLSALKTS